MRQPIYVHTDEGLTRVGTFFTDEHGSKCYQSLRKRSIHFFKKENGWAIDKKILVGLMRNGLDYVSILDKENDVEYQSSVDNFKKYGRTIDYGYGEQIVLSLHYWVKL